MCDTTPKTTPYDLAVLIESTRELLRVAERAGPDFADTAVLIRAALELALNHRERLRRSGDS